MNLTILWISLITILATILRIIGIDKAGGLWNDEYISWSIATLPLGKAFLKGVASQCHMPLYYLYLKIFTLAPIPVCDTIYCVFGNNFMNEGSRLYSRVYEEDSITLNLFGIFLSK